MVPSCQSGFLSLAADRVSAADVILTPSPKTSVGVSRHRALSRKSRQGHHRSMFMPGSRECAYKTASGRHEWPNRDPLGDKIRMDLAWLKRAKAIAILHLPFRPLEALEYPNLYEFAYNEPSSVADALGLIAIRPTGPVYPPPSPHPTPPRPGTGFCDTCPGKHNWQAEGDDSSEDCVKKFMDDLGLFDGGMGAGGGIIGGIKPVTGGPIAIGLGLGFFGQLAIANSFCDGCSQ